MKNFKLLMREQREVKLTFHYMGSDEEYHQGTVRLLESGWDFRFEGDGTFNDSDLGRLMAEVVCQHEFQDKLKKFYGITRL